jgi:mono/diheme cytochrome c family protein
MSDKTLNDKQSVDPPENNMPNMFGVSEVPAWLTGEKAQKFVENSKVIESMYESGGSPMPELEDFLRSLETEQIGKYFENELDPNNLSTESLKLYEKYLSQKRS